MALHPSIAKGLAALLLATVSCASASNKLEHGGPATTPSGVRHAFAVYDEGNQLVRSPIEALQSEILRRAEGPAPPITDVYVITHGWNFTLGESGALYENYMLSLTDHLRCLEPRDVEFEPFFIFVTWSSVTRPLSAAVDSLLPLRLLWPFQHILGFVDSVAFHIPSNWGETVDAKEIALGPYHRRSTFDPWAFSADVECSEYSDLRAAAAESARGEPFEGYPMAASALLDELIRMRGRHGSPYGLHVVGHSFGAKLASLAALDASARLLIAKSCRPGEDFGWANSDRAPPERCDVMIDSLLLIQPAIREMEMFYAFQIDPDDSPRLSLDDLQRLESRGVASTVGTWSLFDDARLPRFERVADTIGRKAVVYTSHDSANGWLFGSANFIVNYNALAGAEFVERSPPQLRSLAFVGDSLWTGVLTILTDAYVVAVAPLRATYEVFTETEGPLSLAKNLLYIPVSPIGELRAVGNQGFDADFVRPPVPDGMLRTWLSNAAVDYLDKSRKLPDSDFERLSGSSCSDAPLPSRWYEVYDASTVFDGVIRNRASRGWGALVNLWPPGAHGDLRSYTRVDCVPRRVRTFHWIYNMTRGWTSRSKSRPTSTND